MRLSEWLEKEASDKIVEVSIASTSQNDFMSKEWLIKLDNGLEIMAFENSKGELSMIDTSMYMFTDLNIAEGFSQDFMFKTLNNLIHGQYEVLHTKLFKKPYIQFTDTSIGRAAFGKLRSQ